MLEMRMVSRFTTFKLQTLTLAEDNCYETLSLAAARSSPAYLLDKLVAGSGGTAPVEGNYPLAGDIGQDTARLVDNLAAGRVEGDAGAQVVACSSVVVGG